MKTVKKSEDNSILPARKRAGLAWAGGFFSAEGCITFENGQLRIFVSQNLATPLLKFRKIVRQKGVMHVRLKEGNQVRDSFLLQFWGIKAFRILRKIAPFCARKRSEIESVLEYTDRCRLFQRPIGQSWDPEVKVHREQLRRRLRALK
jgi:hypothetical protein